MKTIVKNDKGFMTGYKHDIILAMLLFPGEMTPCLKAFGLGCSENLESAGCEPQALFFQKLDA